MKARTNEQTNKQKNERRSKGKNEQSKTKIEEGNASM